MRRYTRSWRALSYSIGTLVVAASAGCGDRTRHPTSPTQESVPNFVHLESDAGDWVGAGHTYEYTQKNAVFSITADSALILLTVHGDQRWSGWFQTPGQRTAFAPGDYSLSNGSGGWAGDGRACSQGGTFTIDTVTFEAGAITALDLRFDQHCDGGAPALRGTIHWRANDPTMPPGPITPIPDSLWRPPAGATPSSGNYVYLQSDAGDYVGLGRTVLFTQPDSEIAVSNVNGNIVVRIPGWGGTMQAMLGVSEPPIGYYAALHRYSLGNPATGGIEWGGPGSACNNVDGWFAIDHATYAGGVITALDLRFEQHCEGIVPALHGAVHWRR